MAELYDNPNSKNGRPPARLRERVMASYAARTEPKRDTFDWDGITKVADFLAWLLTLALLVFALIKYWLN